MSDSNEQSGTDLKAAQELMAGLIREGGLRKEPGMIVVITDGEAPRQPATDDKGEVLVVGDIHVGKSEYLERLAEMFGQPLTIVTMDDQGQLHPPLSDILAHEVEHPVQLPRAWQSHFGPGPMDGLFREPSHSMNGTYPFGLCGKASGYKGYGDGQGLLDLLAGPDNPAVDALLERLSGDMDGPAPDADASK
ncbi:MAG: hypothetical protein JST01_03385 [Cyanobacteria bacterium SZAS TMP-1]|nr:hypothetical protein [Cyanobacteria bacterium SZAS TMP-1]